MIRATIFLLAYLALVLSVGVACLRDTPTTIGWGLLAYALALPFAPRNAR